MPYRGVTLSLAVKQVWVAQTRKKVELFSTHCLLSAAIIHNLQKLFVAGKTCDNAIQLVL